MKSLLLILSITSAFIISLSALYAAPKAQVTLIENSGTCGFMHSDFSANIIKDMPQKNNWGLTLDTTQPHKIANFTLYAIPNQAAGIIMIGDHSYNWQGQSNGKVFTAKIENNDCVFNIKVMPIKA